MNTLLEIPLTKVSMPGEKKDTEEKPLSRFVKEEMKRKEKNLSDILEQTKNILKKLEKFEKRVEQEDRNSKEKKDDLTRFEEKLNACMMMSEKQNYKEKRVDQDLSEIKDTLEQFEAKFQYLDISMQRKETVIEDMKEEISQNKEAIVALHDIEDKCNTLEKRELYVTKEKEKMKRELLDWQKTLEKDQQQQKRCLRCKKASRRRFRDHSSD